MQVATAQLNGYAAQPSPQVLNLRAETCSLFIEITTISAQ